MDDILKVEINPTNKRKLTRTYGDILKEKPYVVFIILERIYIVNYFMEPFKKFGRGQWKTGADYYDRDRDCFVKTTWPASIGRTLAHKDILEIFFCNKKGLTRVLKTMNVQAVWIIYKLMDRGNNAV